jgi:uncharacterized protein DUF3592
MAPLLSLVAPAVVTTFGAYVTVSQLVWALRAWRTSSWPTCPGTIERANVVPTGTRIDRGHGSFSVFVASLSYRYAVAGRPYKGKLISYRGYIPNEERVEKIVARYPHGAQVNVAYDPRNPSIAVLEPGLGVGNCLGVAMGVALFAAGAVWLRLILGAA